MPHGSQLLETYPKYFMLKEKINLSPSLDVDKILKKIAEKYNNEKVDLIDGVRIDFIDEIIYDAPLVSLINENINKIKYWVLGIAVFFLIISILVINSSIRLSIYSNRINIKTMQLVGATRGFIRKPFILTHVKLGFFGAFFAIVMLSGALYYIQNFFDYVNFESDIQIIMAMFGAISIFSILITYLCTFFATQKFLKSKIDQLY